VGKSIYFSFGIHNHQPVGNFAHIFESAFQDAYLLFIELLLAHPKVKTSIHYSGPLWDYIQETHSDFFDKLKTLLDRGQLEIMGGGYYEPILPNIPERDRVGQIKALSQEVKDCLGVVPRGMWTAERVWEPQLASSMAKSGMQYTVLDESHFHYAGVPHDGLYGYYMTEDEGHSLAVFPIRYRLRHLIPFAPPEDTIEFLRTKATTGGERLAVFADDGEKFGVWPGTYQTAYLEKWLERFFKLLEENSDWIKMINFSEYLDKYPPVGRIYLPVASYFEMTEWALPTPAGKNFQNIIKEVKNDGKWEYYEPFLRGGFWRNFLVKYPESNNMQKKALYVSNKIAELKDQQEKAEIQKELWRGQCNCAYWHGVFGGLYLSHLRSSVYEHLIKAQQMAESLTHHYQPFVNSEVFDFDCDGRPEVLLNSESMLLGISPHLGGQLFELDYKPLAINFLDTMSRREEIYHEKIRELADKPEEQTSDKVSIHDMSRMKQGGLEKYLQYDWYRRVSLLDHFLHPDTTLEGFAFGDYGEQGDFIQQPYRYELNKSLDTQKLKMSREGHVWVGDYFLPINLEKNILLGRNQQEFLVEYRLENPGEARLPFWFGVEWNLGFLSGHDDGSYYLIDDRKIKDPHLAGWGSEKEITRLTMMDGVRKVKFSFELDNPGDLWRFPLETISQSESGFEKNYQNSVLLFNWKLELGAKEKKSLRFKVIVSPFDRIYLAA